MPASPDKPLSNRTALITGASRGIGYAAALALAEAGAHCIVLARTQGGLEELDDAITQAGGTATIVVQDLLEHEKIDNLGAALYERWGKLDIFVGNAGILGSLSPLGHVDPNEWDRVIATNLTSNWRLLRSLDPLLRNSDAARVILVTCPVGKEPKAYWASYAVSKSGLEALAQIYAAEHENTSVNCNLLDPGSVNTALHTQAMPGIDPETLTKPAALGELFVELAAPDCQHNGALIAYNGERGDVISRNSI